MLFNLNSFHKATRLINQHCRQYFQQHPVSMTPADVAATTFSQPDWLFFNITSSS